MKRRRLVRVQLLLLALLVILVFVRWITGPPAPSGLVVFHNLKADELYHRAFELEQSARLSIEATGSFERTPGSEALPPLDVYGWIVRRSDRQPAWQMQADQALHERGTLANVADTLDFDAGIYDVYFTSYGNAFSGNDTWRRDRNRWQMVVRTVAGGPAHYLDASFKEARPAGPTVVWTSAPAEGHTTATFPFEVRQTTPIHLYAVGELADHQARDYGWIEDASTGERVWTMTYADTEPAGGPDENRRYEGTLTLEPGFYRAGYQTNDRHHASRWRANPPLDPAAWGLTLRADPPDAIVAFDPWANNTPVLQFSQVTDNAHLTQKFSVTRPVHVVIYSMGEITGHESVWDYGWLKRGEETIWKMSAAQSHPAGGDGKNRAEMAFLTLEPGTYTLGYQTDGSHNYGDWNEAKPDHPERWGVTLFALDNADAIRPGLRLDRAGHDDAQTPQRSETMVWVDQNSDTEILTWNRVKEDFAGDFRFTLTEPTRLHITALGEQTMQGWHDYGWIENEAGERVWTMTTENTHAAGGDERNRRFDDVVELAPGVYSAHYKTDFSHNFNDFGLAAPDHPEAWGMTIRTVGN